MALSKLDVQEFLSNYKALIEAVTGISPDGFEEWLDARDKMLGSWQQAKVSQQLSENPIYQVLPQAVYGQFCFLKKYKSHYALQHVDSKQFFAVQVLSTPLNEMLPEYSMVETCLLSFNGLIVCDGLLRGSGIILGNKMAKSMRLAYWDAKRSGELIEQFNMPEFNKEQLEEDVAADTPSLSSARLDNPLPRKRLRQLRLCKKEELVVLLEELADEHRVVNDRVNLFLKRGNPKELVSELRRAIDRVGRSGEYINHYFSDGVASELHDVLSSIERDLIPSDPGVALEVLHYFIVTDDRIIAHADDSSGSIGDAYSRACTLLGKASQATGQPKQAVEIFYDLSESNKYGVRDSLFDEAANVLNEVALAQLVETWRKQASNEDPTKYWGICSRLAQVAKSMGDPELHEEATLRGRPKDEFPLLAIDVARVYFDCGKPEVALIKLPSEEASYHFYQRSELLLKIQKKLGNTRAVSVELLRRFKCNGSANDAMKYLEGISDDNKHAEAEKLHQIIRAGDFQVLEGDIFAWANLFMLLKF